MPFGWILEQVWSDVGPAVPYAVPIVAGVALWLIVSGRLLLPARHQESLDHYQELLDAHRARVEDLKQQHERELAVMKDRLDEAVFRADLLKEAAWAAVWGVREANQVATQMLQTGVRAGLPDQGEQGRT